MESLLVVTIKVALIGGVINLKFFSQSFFPLQRSVQERDQVLLFKRIRLPLMLITLSILCIHERE